MLQNFKNITYCFLLTFFFLSFQYKIEAQSATYEFMFDGEMRNYIVHLPPNYQEGSQLPLVFNLHGYTSNAAEQELYTQFSVVADTANFIVVYPNGIDNQWNSFGLGGADDVGFINALIDTMHVNYNINLSKVFSTGMSNGGYMSYKLACELNDRIAAIASVTGGMTQFEFANCSPGVSIPVMQIHGTADPTVPYTGGFQTEPIEDIVDFWVENNSCNTEPNIIQIEDIDMTDMCTAERFEYLDCDENTQVIFYKITGGAHTWPGAPLNLSITNMDFNASNEIWIFFNQYGGDTPSGNKEIEAIENLISYAPNPVQDLLNIELHSATIKTIELYNAVGQVVYQKNNPSQNLTIDLSSFAAGIYFLGVKTKTGTRSVSLVKK